MKTSSYKSYDELPLFPNADTVAKALGISPSDGYELVRKADSLVLKVGGRMVVPKEKFVNWMVRVRLVVPKYASKLVTGITTQSKSPGFVPGMVRFSLVEVQPQVITAKCSRSHKIPP